VTKADRINHRLFLLANGVNEGAIDLEMRLD
jgi:hypothetical protein